MTVNYIDATIYNITLYLIYSFNGFPLLSRIKGYVYVECNEDYLLTATNCRYVVSRNEYLNEWLDMKKG